MLNLSTRNVANINQLVGQNLTNGTSPKPWGPWVLNTQRLQLDPCPRVTVVWQRKMVFSSCLDNFFACTVYLDRNLH